MKNDKQVLIVTCKCGKTAIQAGDPELFKDLKSKRQLGELAMNGHQIKTIPFEEYKKYEWYCKSDTGEKYPQCVEL